MVVGKLITGWTFGHPVNMLFTTLLYVAKMSVKSKIHTLVPENILKAQVCQKKNLDKRHLIPSFSIGTQVLLKNMARQARQGGKMESHFTGPYEIVEELGKGVYRLKNLKTQKVLAKTYSSMRFKVHHSVEVSDRISHSPAKKRKHDDCEHPSPEPVQEKKICCLDNWLEEMNLKLYDREAIETNCE